MLNNKLSGGEAGPAGVLQEQDGERVGGVRPFSLQAEVWLDDSPEFSLPVQFRLTAAPCNLSQLDSLQLQPLCETRLEDSIIDTQYIIE